MPDNYLTDVAALTQPTLEGLTPDDLERVVDRRWDPLVALGVRLVSIADDNRQHAGQAACVRGLLSPCPSPPSGADQLDVATGLGGQAFEVAEVQGDDLVSVV